MIKMLGKRILGLAAAVLLIASGTVSAFGAEFYDVPEGAWYHDYVNELSDKGVINGRGGGYFAPAENVLHAEALKLVLTAAGKEIEDPAEAVWITGEGVPWYEPVVAAADRYGIAESGTYEPLEPATREEVCAYIVRGMEWQKASHPEDVFIDTGSDNAEILYWKGIVTGIAGLQGYSFSGGSSISRAEAATLIYRMMGYDPLGVKKLTGITDAEGFEFKNPVTVSDWEKIVMYMGRHNIDSYTAIYSKGYEPELSWNDVCQNAIDAYGECYDRCNEYFCYGLTAQARVNWVKGIPTVNLTVSNSEFSTKEMESMRGEFFELASEKVAELVRKGKITADMSEKEKARAIFNYICEKCSYDDSESNTTRHFGYSAITSGKTVCQGYTALLNAMLKSAGIWCETVPGELTDRTPAEKHIWTRAMVDGEITYIDMTFGDSSRRSPNYEYFCVPRESLTRNRIWN